MEKPGEMLKEVLIRHQHIRLCIVFGSIAKDMSSSDSDLEIAVAAEQPLSADEFLELIEAFSAATNQKIDLLDLMTASGEILRQAPAHRRCRAKFGQESLCTTNIAHAVQPNGYDAIL